MDVPEGAEEVFQALLAAEEIERLSNDLSVPFQFGDFRIVREAGRGGMGIVYDAIQVSLGRRVALKILPPGVLSNPRAVRRFHREARIAASLHHPNIVTVHAMGVQGGTPYYAMLTGQSPRKLRPL
jgi:hypothetical protein